VSQTIPTLAEIAVSQPAATQVFMRHGLDFCCHGQRSLADACAERGIDPEVVLDELGAARTEAPRGGLWSERPLTELIDFILERFHAPLRSDLPALVELAKKVEDVHAGKPSCPRGIAQHLAHVLVEVEIHLAKEERILFPLIRAGRGPTALMPIKVMMQEHEDHGVNLRRTRALTGDLAAPPEACASWRSLYQGLAQLEADLMEHIHLENNVLFPRALREAPSEAAL